MNNYETSIGVDDDGTKWTAFIITKGNLTGYKFRFQEVSVDTPEDPEDHATLHFNFLSLDDDSIEIHKNNAEEVNNTLGDILVGILENHCKEHTRTTDSSGVDSQV